MTARRQTTIRLPDDLAEQAEAITAEVDRARASKSFNERARDLRRREKVLLKRPAR